MPCIPFRVGEATGFICTGRARRRRCSTPGCSNWATQECDAGVASRDATRKVPKVGDARVHRQHAVIFYVHEVQTNPDDPDDQIVCIATTPPGARPVRSAQSVKAEEWYFKTDATCNRPICVRCAHKVGKLEYCGAHARALTERTG